MPLRIRTHVQYPQKPKPAPPPAQRPSIIFNTQSTPWTAPEDEVLRARYEEDGPTKIGEKLGRSPGAVIQRFRKLRQKQIPIVIPTIGPLHTIKVEVCAKHGITMAELVSKCRTEKLARARFEGYWRAHNETSASLTEIARAFNLEDQTTVKHGIQRHAQIIVSALSPLS